MSTQSDIRPCLPQQIWHSSSSDEVLQALDSTRNGLSDPDAVDRLHQYGRNRLPQEKRQGCLKRLFNQFNNVLIYVLLIAGVLTGFLGHWIDSTVIMGVVILNALIGFIQEGRAEAALQAVHSLLANHAVAIRDGQRQQISVESLVPGDILVLEAGERVAADVRLLECHGLQIDESMLTGESVPVIKVAEKLEPNTEPNERHNLAYSGTLVTNGQGSGVVVATATDTAIGQIGSLLSKVETLTTPLLLKINRLGKRITLFILLFAALTFLIGVGLRGFGYTEMFLATVGLAVAAVPEGLPAIISITLAVGVQSMAKREVIIRQLPAVEALGSVTVICTDKTGTLTRNEMSVQRVETAQTSYHISGSGYSTEGDIQDTNGNIQLTEHSTLQSLIRAAILCNDAALVRTAENWQFNGDPTENALLVLALKAQHDPNTLRQHNPRSGLIPFDAEYKLMASAHTLEDGSKIIYIKGAPEAILGRCRTQCDNGHVMPLQADKWHQKVEEMAQQGLRVLALALIDNHLAHEPKLEDIADNLHLLGLVGLIDPPREQAAQSVALCQTAGIQVKMITGDHVTTARAIGNQLGIGLQGATVTGLEIEKATDHELRQLVRHADIFARANPGHKLRLVQALQDRGEVVAMTGDGVNDAPSLKRADVGVAMGKKGSEAAKEAAKIVITDDNFASIVNAVEEGRRAFDNIRKSIIFILPTSVGEAMTIVMAVLLGWALPISAVQILWINMVTTVTLALALSFEPAEADIMQRAPRDPSQPLFDRFMIWRTALVSSLMVISVFAFFFYYQKTDIDLETIRTLSVNLIVCFETFYLFNMRSLIGSVLSFKTLAANWYILGAVGLIGLLQGLFTYTPIFQHFFRTKALDVHTWLAMLTAGLGLFFLVELEKWIVRLYQNRN